MTVRVEVFATGSADPAAVWGVVGDLGRLPEWTDAESVQADAEPTPGAEFITVEVGRSLRWRVVTAEPGLIEAVVDLGRARVGIGARVTADPGGSRIVLAGAIEPARGRLRATLLDGPALRRRFDRWSHAALRVASAV